MPKKPLHDHHYTAKPIHDHTGRYARTLQEAFGPHAEWHVERRPWLDRKLPRIAVLLVVVAVATLLWAVQK